MKKFNYLSIIIILFFFLTAPNNLFANYKGGEKEKGKKPALQKTAINPRQSLMNINNATMWVTDEGFHDWVVASSWNGAFPNGSSVGAIFAEGVVWGGQVSDGKTPVVRVDGNTYGTGCAPIIRLYRVRPDYLTGDLSSDAATFNNIPIGQVTDADIQALRDQYATDWAEWPAGISSPDGNQGAPYKDVDGNGSYDPNIDIPGIPGASQTLFIKYSDALSESNYGSPPIGLEVSETYWAYSYSGALGNVIYKKMDMIYKGTPTSASNSKIDSMFIVQWADPDVGTSTDDFAGCDTTLNLGYAYNADPTDATYAGVGLAPPAVGYDFFSGASKFTGNLSDSAIIDLKWKKGYKYINRKPMSSFIYFAASGAWSDPPFSYNGTLQFYNLMRGKLPLPAYPSAAPFPTTVADVTPDGTYLLDGDPVTHTGKLDGSVEGKGDRRIMVVNGPITMALGDTAQIVLGLVYGLGQDNLSSVSALKQNDNTAQIVFDQLFQLPSIDPPTVKAAALDQEVVLNWDVDANSIYNIENFTDKGYTFQGYEVYQVPSSSSSLSDGILLGNYDIIDGVKAIYDTIPDANGTLIPTLVSKATDKGVSRNITITTDQVRKQALRNGQEYYFVVVSYAYNPTPLLPFHVLRSPFVIQRVVPQQQMGFVFNDKTGNAQDVTHSEGVADATANATIVDPTATTGHNYEIFFSQRSEVRNASGDWVASGVEKLKKPGDLTGTTIDIAGLYGPNPASGVQLSFTLNLESPTGAWSDGVSLTFPAGVTILSAPSFEAGGGTIVPEIVGNTINMGDVTQANTEYGVFHGGETWDVFISPPALPLDVDWIVYDDTYGNPAGTNPVNASGTFSLTTIGELARTAKYWNLRDATSGVVKLENQSVLSGVDLYPRRDDLPTTDLGTAADPIVDGVQVGVDGSYAAPLTFSSINPPTVNGTAMGSGSRWTSTNFILTNFIYFGYADGTADASLGAYFDGAHGTTDVSQLQQDIELRWTGVMADTTINGTAFQYVQSGGSLITLAGASGYDITNHPLNPNYGTSDAPFTIRVPFEIWNLDTNEEITAILWDRSGTGATAWVQDNRQYMWVVNVPNSATPLDPVSQTVTDHATWNLVFYQSTYNLGDVVRINYDNPLLAGVDVFSFNTNGATYSADVVKSQVEKINVFPNPYYGYQYRELAPNNKYVTFSHLPANAVIRIFDLSGVLVKTINHVSTSGQFDTWNLANDNNYPVASGIYIVYIDMPDVGTTKILKLAVVQEQQMLKVY
jgi:hypothetical protein